MLCVCKLLIAGQLKHSGAGSQLHDIHKIPSLSLACCNRNTYNFIVVMHNSTTERRRWRKCHTHNSNGCSNFKFTIKHNIRTQQRALSIPSMVAAMRECANTKAFLISGEEIFPFFIAWNLHLNYHLFDGNSLEFRGLVSNNSIYSECRKMNPHPYRRHHKLPNYRTSGHVFMSIYFISCEFLYVLCGHNISSFQSSPAVVGIFGRWISSMCAALDSHAWRKS